MRRLWRTSAAAAGASLFMATIALAQGMPGSSQPEPAKTPAPAATPSVQPEAPKGSAGATQGAVKRSGKKAAKPAAGKSAVKAVQEALKAKGHDPGPIDGLMGPKTSAALKEFQKNEGLPDTGRLDAGTRAKLGV